MKLGLIEVNGIKVVVDHKGDAWVKRISKNGQIYWEADHVEGVNPSDGQQQLVESITRVYKGHPDMVKYLKRSVYHNYRQIGVSDGWITVRKTDKPRFVTVNFGD